MVEFETCPAGVTALRSPEMSPTRVTWSHETLPPNRWNEEDIATLTVDGLPEYYPALTVEFGLYESPEGTLIIGEDLYASDAAYIFMRFNSPAVWYGHPCEDAPIFVNTSVSSLKKIMDALWQGIPVSEIMSIDPGIEKQSSSLWMPVLERLRATCES